MSNVKKIVIIGPESTGKSTLCEQLATHFKRDWVREYAREYLEAKSSGYTYDELLIIAKGQIELEEKYQFTQADHNHFPVTNGQASKKPLFIDTDMYVMQVWCEFTFGRCHNWILQQIASRKYDLYLLCNIDLQWIKDELREYPDPLIRKKLYQYYKEQMINQYTPWIEIKGNYAQRLQLAVEAVNRLY